MEAGTFNPAGAMHEHRPGICSGKAPQFRYFATVRSGGGKALCPRYSASLNFLARMMTEWPRRQATVLKSSHEYGRLSSVGRMHAVSSFP